jgi:hypothetical protein
MPDDHRSRDTAFAQLLAEALKSHSKPGGDAKASSCPDAEVLAAYAEHALTGDETARWESHFADCSRCQKIIAVLAASGDELTTAEVQRLGALAAASVAREPAVQRPARSWTAIWRRPVLWRWLVPAVGMASAVLWFALRQPPAREALSSQNIATTAGAPQSGTAQGNTAASSGKSDETQIAQAHLPSPPPQAPPPQALLRDKEALDRSSSPGARQEPTRKKESVQSAAPASPASEADRALENHKDLAEDNRVLSAQAAQGKSQLNDKLAPAAPAAAPSAPVRPAAVPSVSPPAEAGGAAKQSLDQSAAALARKEVQVLAKTAPALIVFSSPDGAALWRVGSGGAIEHSSDQGKTWQSQASGVTAELLAGSAASNTVAWAVGRAGTILRTEDGEHWQRVAPPSTAQPDSPQAMAPDWIGVEARDARHATITSRDLRRFATADGGRAWAQQR